MLTTIVEHIKELQEAEIPQFLSDASRLTDELGRAIFQTVAKNQVPMWINDLSIDKFPKDRVAFRLYAFEDAGMLSSKIELKSGRHYERKFYPTEFGKTIAASFNI